MKISLLLEDLLLELSPTEIYKSYYKDINYTVFKYFVMSDPQTVIQDGKIIRLGKYSKLLLHLYKTEALRMEDLPKAKEYLVYVYKYHIPLDVRKIESLSDIYNSVKKYMVVDTQDFDTAIKSLSRGKDYEVLMDGQQWLILQPLTEKGSCYLGIGTQWCTSYGPYSTNKDYNERENRFGQYNRQGPLYIIIDKGYKPNKFQFHFESNQFMSPEDRRIDVAEFLKASPEIRNFFFPSFVRKVTEDELKLEMNHIKVLSQEDSLELIRKFSEIQGIQNPIVTSILNTDREKVAELIQDEGLGNEVYLDGNWIVFDFKKLPYELQEVDDYLRRLDNDKYNAWDHVYVDIQDGMDGSEEWTRVLEPIFKEYYEKNADIVRYDLGAFNYELFKTDFFQGFYEDDNIQETYIDSAARNSYENFEFRVETEINEVKKYLSIDGSEVKISMANFVMFITKNEIENINGNLDEIMEKYLIECDLDNFDDYDYYYDYERSDPTYKDMESAVENYFESLTNDVESTRQCVEIRKKFNDIYTRFFKNNPTYENEHIYIHINDLKVNCDNGSVNITYNNKDKNKTYSGYIKVENLPVYATNYALFESFMDFRKNIISEQSEIKELFGVSFDARAWTPIIEDRLRLAKTYYRKKLPVPDLTINGREYPKQYNMFPIDVLHIYINMSYGNGAAYDENKSGYDENNQYHVYLYFGPESNYSAINHELRHAYEDFMRMSRGGTSIKSTKEGSLLFGGDFEKFFMEGHKYKPYHSLILGLYITSKIERSGYSESVYDNDVEASEMIKHAIKDANNISLSPDKLKANWDEIKNNFRVPVFDKFNDYQSFIKWASDEIKYKGEKSLKKLRKVEFYRKQNKQKGAV